jgi:3-hydroxyacyl-CoA dehydrogenase/enoyl-CoA hydratase/carnithine racemase
VVERQPAHAASVPFAAVEIRRVGDVAVLALGEEASRPPVLGRGALSRLAQLLDELERGRYRGLVVTGSGSAFCAGADLDEVPALTTREAAVAASRAGHELFARLAALPFPTVAAIDGACVGGGLELALHCRARVASTHLRHLGFPECFLGLIPAWGGTQLTPRLAGPDAAIRVVVQNPMRRNRLLDAGQALELGLVDRLLEPGDLLAGAVELALEPPAERPDPDWSRLDQLVAAARADLDDTIHGAAVAPYRALDLIAGARAWSLEEGYRREEEVAGELVPGPQAQASVYAFDLVERRARRRPPIAAEPRPVRKVGIVGAGAMASQLAALVLRRLEVPVVLRDVEGAIVERALESIRGDLAESGRLGSLLTGTTGWEGFADCDLVVEAVVEDLAVKRAVFSELRGLARPECVLATNTSALSVEAVGADLGLHFFNPVALLPLVELVRTPTTSEAALATAYEAATRLRKRPVLVTDSPGFVVNRVLTRMMSVVLDALEHGNTVEEVDEAILRLGLPVAPSVLLQLVGPRVAREVLSSLHRAFPERFPLFATLDNYADGRDEIVLRGERPRSAEDLLRDALEAVADEIRRLLDEGVVGDARDVDTALLLGAGWPFWLGGITKHLDQTGISVQLFGRTFE